MTVPHKNIRWRKSTRSETGDCVELGHTGAVRDSKNPTGPSLPADIGPLVEMAKNSRLAR